MNNETRQKIYRTATVCGWLCAGFLLIFSVQMFFLYVSRLPNIPSEEETYVAQRKETRQNDGKPEAQKAFQKEDFRMREQFFTQRNGFSLGAKLTILLLLGMTACFAAASAVKAPEPDVPGGGKSAVDTDSVQAVRTVYALTAVGVISVAAIFLMCVPGTEGGRGQGAGAREISSDEGIFIGRVQSIPGYSHVLSEVPDSASVDFVNDAPAGENPITVSPENVSPAENPVSPENPTVEEKIETPPEVAVNEITPENETAAPAIPTETVAAEKLILPAKLAPPAETPHWTRFRGPRGDGVSAFKNVPQEWDDASGKNILWKVPVPQDGFSSPVVWEKNVFLTGGTEESREIYCFDADTGELRWTYSVPATEAGASAAENPDYHVDHTGYAPSTGATDGVRFYAIFTNGDLVAVDFSGQEIWRRGLGVPKNMYGHASSLTLFENLLFVQYDQGSKSQNLSKVLAVNTETGETVWETARPGIPNSWPTPITVTLTATHDGREITQTQLITAADPFVTAYDAHTGRELWKVKCLQADVGPSPIVMEVAETGEPLIVVANEFPQVTGIKPPVVLGNTEAEDLTKTHIAWKDDMGLPDTVSPLAVGGKYVLLLDKSATITCMNAADGEMLWDDYKWTGKLLVTPTASPGLVGEKVFLVTDVEEKRGDVLSRCYVLTITDSEMEIEKENTLTEGCVTSPAFADGRIYLRGAKHLYALGEKE